MFIQVFSNIWAYVCVCIHVQMREFVRAHMHTQHTHRILSFIFKEENSTNLYGHSFVALLVFLLFYLPESVWAYSFFPLGI